eukprot:174502_1
MASCILASVIYCLMLCVPCNRGLNEDSLMVWSDSLDATNDDHWVIYGSVDDAVHSNHCPSSMNCWLLESTTDKIATSMTTSIPTEHYLNLTLSYGITITDTLATNTSHRDYCHIYYKTNHMGQTTTIENWKLLASYYFNATNLMANKRPLQSHTLSTNEAIQSIDIRLMNTANDAVPSLSCYVDEISLTADYYDVSSSSTGRMNTIFVAFVVPFSIAVCIILIFVVTKVYFNMSAAAAKDEAVLIKVSDADMNDRVESVSAAAPSPTPVHNGDAQLTTPISAVEHTNTTMEEDVASNEDIETIGMHIDTKQDGKDPNRRDTQNKLSDIMHEVLSSPSNHSHRASEKLDDIPPATAEETTHDTDGENDGFEYNQYSQYRNAPKRESDSFQSYEVEYPNTFTQSTNVVTNENDHHRVSFAEDSVGNVLKTRYPAKKETLSDKQSGASSTNPNTQESSPALKDVQYDSSEVFAVFDEEDEKARKSRKYTQHREEESLEVDERDNDHDGTFKEISLKIHATQYSDRAPDYKGESGTEMPAEISENADMDEQKDQNQSQ